jgi:hypothetical protein
MPNLVMLNFQPIVGALPIGSTSTTQANKAQEVEEEMEIELQEATSEVGTKVKETSSNRPLSKR